MNIEVLTGLTFSNVEVLKNDDEIIFTSTDGRKFRLFHDQDCCESVTIEDVTGDIQDLIGSPITKAEESTKEREYEMQYGTCHETWTFYHLATVKGYVTLRWYGTSNGYYSENVNFEEIKTPQPRCPNCGHSYAESLGCSCTYKQAVKAAIDSDLIRRYGTTQIEGFHHE